MTHIIDAIIWIGSVAAGLSVLAGAVIWLVRRAESRQAKALLGDWYGYAFYDARSGPVFYREKIRIHRSLLPWRFLIMSTPITDGDTNPYVGRLRVRSPWIYVTMREEVYEDYTFEISRRTMDERHSDDLVIGIHLGRAYEESIHSACAYVWCRKPLDPAASATALPNPEVEKAKFLELVAGYFEVDSATYQLKMK